MTDVGEMKKWWREYFSEQLENESRDKDAVQGAGTISEKVDEKITKVEIRRAITRLKRGKS